MEIDTSAPNKAESSEVEQLSNKNSTEKEATTQSESSIQTESAEKEPKTQPESSIQKESAEKETKSQPESTGKESTEKRLEDKSTSKSLPLSSLLGQREQSAVLKNGPAPKKQCLDHNSMSASVYLDATVVPILHASLVNLARIRPADPVQFVIDYLLCHKEKFSKINEKSESSSSVNSTPQA